MSLECGGSAFESPHTRSAPHQTGMEALREQVFVQWISNCRAQPPDKCSRCNVSSTHDPMQR
ncbi:hypothetical protein XHV734_1694 [Xanthomonas hortorum pv. vitians]|nr:hypothetical protein XHV734_1694 [Xanthomonas hortorum pv. vitians]